MISTATQKILGFASIPLFLLVIAVLALLNIPTVFEHPYVLAVMNTLFLGIIPILIAYIAARVFLKSGSLSMLLAGAGILIFGLGSIAAGWLNPLPGGANMTVTIHNTCACIGSVFVLAGAILSRPAPVSSKGIVRRQRVGVLYSGILVFVLLFSLAAMQGLTPAFFIPGAGPTELRQVILENAVVFFALSSFIFMALHLRERTDFFFWYAVSLALIDIGLVAVFIQPSVGSLIGWAGRSAQYIGFVVALYAGFIAYRVATAKGIPIESVIANFFVDAEKSYRQLVETATDAIVTFDEDYRVILWNAAAERMFGYTYAEAIGSSFLQLAIDEQYIDLMKNGITDAPVFGTQTPVPKSFEIFCKRKDGTLFPADLTVSLRWQDGRPIRTVILRDLTERKRAEDALQKSEEKYRMLFSNMQDGFAYCRMMYDSDGQPEDFIYLNVNSAFDRITGTKTVTMKRVTEVYPGIKEAFPELFLIYGRVAWTGTPEAFDINFKPIEKWLHISVYSPEKGYFVAVFEDITDRKQTEEKIARLASFPQLNPQMIFEIEPAEQVVFVNPAMQATMKRLELSSPLTFIPEDVHQMIQTWDALTYAYCDRECSVAGRHFFVTIYFSPEYRSIRFYLSDITERKQAEDALRQANKQLHLLSSITRHDILNQLLALKGYLELSREYLGDNKTLLDFITKEEKAAKTIEHQITFTKDYQNLGIVAPVWQNVNASINKALSKLPMRDVHVEIDPKNPEIFADPLFEKVFYNLIDNALRYGGEDMKTIQFSSQEVDTGLTIVCEDDGVGISVEDKKRLFTKGFGKNTGLGLFLSREILAITGITITENGVPGKGARFEITVPKGMWRMKGVNV